MAMDPFTMDPADPEGGLLSVLKRIQDLQSAPLIPQNPLSQLGVALQGFHSGMTGQPNPALVQAQQQRAFDLQGLKTQADLGKDLVSLRQTTTKHAKDEQDRRMTVMRDMAKVGLASEDASYRAFGATLARQVLSDVGAKVPDDMIAALAEVPFNATKAEDAIKLHLMGVPGEVISRRHGISAPMLSHLITALENDDTRKLLGLKSKAELFVESQQILDRQLDAIKKQIDIRQPNVSKELITHGVSLWDKAPDEISWKEWGVAARELIAKDLERAAASAGMQPVPESMQMLYTSVLGSIDNLEVIRDVLEKTKDRPGTIEQYMGRMRGILGFREMMDRWTGALDPHAAVMAFAEDQLRNIILKARSGQAVTKSEEARILKETPDRSADAPPIYRIKLVMAMRTAGVLRKRIEMMSSPEGRKALHTGGLAGAAQYAANQVIPALPLPDEEEYTKAIKGAQKQPTLPGGFSVAPGQRH